MSQTKKQIEAHLAEANARPRHRFGQNFMVEPNLVRIVADAGEIQPGDLVVEVGPGTGTLTEVLLERAQVVAVEIDRDLAASLADRLGDRITLIVGDALAGKHALNPQLATIIETGKAAKRTVRLVANLPYNIASPLVVELLLAGVHFLAFTVQKEVADRMKAGPDSPGDYGPLTVTIQSLAEVKVLRTIPPTAFWPRPTIDSALVTLRRGVNVNDGRAFSRFVTAAFGQRRKALRNPLSKIISSERLPSVLDAAGLTGAERAEQVSVEQFRTMFQAAAGE